MHTEPLTGVHSVESHIHYNPQGNAKYSDSTNLGGTQGTVRHKMDNQQENMGYSHTHSTMHRGTQSTVSHIVQPTGKHRIQ